MSTAVDGGEDTFFPKDVTLNLSIGASTTSGIGAGQGTRRAEHKVTLNSGLTILIGPNGSGKTHILRALQTSLAGVAKGKHTRFISAGRIGMTEQYRAVHNIYNPQPSYENANFGSYDQRTSRHVLETLEGDYQNIVERPDIQLKIRERLRKLFRRDLALKWHNGSLKVEFAAANAGGERYSAAREASGLVHLAGLLSAIYDDQIGVLLLDEPEVSLHPQLQAFLLREITSVAGAPGARNKKIIVISTHSTEFLKVDDPEDLPNLIFTTSVFDQPVQIARDAPELRSRKVAELISRMGQEHKLSFFAKSPLLVEGPSDSIICSGLCSKLGIHIEAGGSQILPVVGKGQFPVVTKLLRLMGKSPIVLADADALTDGNELVQAFADSDLSNEFAISNGHDSVMKLYSLTQNAFTSLIESSWPAIQPMAEQTLYWKTKSGAEEDEIKLKRRAAFSAMFCNDINSLPTPYKAMRMRLASVMEALEVGGCHILRRGTIEGYYETQVDDLEGKPSAAADEVIAFKQRAPSDVEEHYSDIVRCLKQAAQTEFIDEADLLRDALITILAPIIAKIRHGGDIDVSRLLSQSEHPFASLFDISREQDLLVVKLKSNILDFACFPLNIDPEDDVVTSVTRQVRVSGT